MTLSRRMPELATGASFRAAHTALWFDALRQCSQVPGLALHVVWVVPHTLRH